MRWKPREKQNSVPFNFLQLHSVFITNNKIALFNIFKYLTYLLTFMQLAQRSYVLHHQASDL